ncbi:MAG: hypothetical protein ACHQAQ_09715 [Hyphomicrobiales bacterium]
MAIGDGGRGGSAPPAESHHAYLFEAKGIQRYIFDSGPLRDLVGASDLVAELAASPEGAREDADDVLRTEAASELVAETGYDLIGKVLWALGVEERGATRFSRRAGGAFCLHSDSPATLDRVRALWRLVVGLHCPGLEISDSGQVSARDEIDALNSAYEAGSAVRTNTTAELPPTGHPFTAFNPRTGRLATRLYAYWDSGRKVDDVSAVDVVTEAQRRRGQRLQDIERLDGAARRFLGRETRKAGRPYVFPRNLDPDEGDSRENPLFPFRDEEDSRIGIVHADLSGLGQIFQSATDPAKVRDAAVVLEIATAIERIIEGAAQEATRNVLLPAARAWPPGRPAGSAEIVQHVVPARPVLLGGDDITILVRGDLALPFTHLLLAEIEKRSEEKFKALKDAVAKNCPALALPDRLSACAGVAIVKAGQPFLMSNALAESLCKFAKTSAKSDPEGRAREAPYPSFLAFHVAQSTLREEYRDILDREMTAGDVRLTGNPYRVGTASDGGEHAFAHLLKLAEALLAAPRGRGKLIEAGALIFDDAAAARAAWIRWREVLHADNEDGGAALHRVDEALASIAGADVFEKALGVVSDALELVDLGSVAAPAEAGALPSPSAEAG